MQYTGFTQLDISHAFTANITRSDRFNVVITADDNLVDYLDIRQRGDTLYIGVQSGRTYTGTTFRAEITLPTLEGLNVSGASRANLSGFSSTQRLALEASGASVVRGDVKCGDVSFNVSGASQVTLSGTGQDAVLEVSGASRVQLEDMSFRNVDVEASGASSVTVNLEGRLDASASGASNILYVGSPTLGRIEESGASSVRRK